MENKILKSHRHIRFSDCDPMGHLFNVKYLNYFLDAREDQVREIYGFDMDKVAKLFDWALLVGTHQISYLHPALYNEEVEISSSIIDHSEKWILVEFLMRDTHGKIKSLMWSHFISFDIKNNTTAPMPSAMKKLILKYAAEKPAADFFSRFKQLKAEN